MRPGHATVSEFFDSYACEFDSIYGTRNTLLNRLINKYFRRSMRLRFQRTIQGCDPIQERSVLDIGCGPGHYAITLARNGAQPVLGIDFAEEMINLAKKHAQQAGVADRCLFTLGDFLEYPINDRYDYAIVMGFMDYMADPRAVIHKVLLATRRRAFFSFPVAGGILAWQRKLRYQRRCELFLYTAGQLYELFSDRPDGTVKIQRIARDFFVTVTMQ